jgi:hypothetical protein
MPLARVDGCLEHFDLLERNHATVALTNGAFCFLLIATEVSAITTNWIGLVVIKPGVASDGGMMNRWRLYSW